MKTINQPNFQACFVNTDQHPKKVFKHPFFSVNKDDKRVFQLQTWVYEHPDTDISTISVLVWQEVKVAKKSFPAFESMANGMKSLEALIL